MLSMPILKQKISNLYEKFKMKFTIITLLMLLNTTKKEN